MKRILNYVTCITLFLILTAATSQAGLISYFDFEGDAEDHVGGYNGSVYGATLTGGYNGGQAYFFDGNDYIRAGLNINPGALPQLTMGAWVKASSGSAVRQVISHDNGGFDRSLGIDSRGGSLGWSAFSGSGHVLGGHEVNLNTWTFLAVVYDQSAGSVTLYKDGNYMSEAGSLGGGNTYLHIGNNPLWGGSEFFSGVIDDVFFIDEALTVDQLNSVRQNGVSSLSAVPEPTTMLLLGFGLLGLAGVNRRNK